MRCRFHRAAILAACLALLASPAAADDVTVTTNVTLTGLNSSGVTVGFQSTDLGATTYSCSPNNGQTCSKSNKYGDAPKNMHLFMCLPNGTTYQIAQQCQAVLGLTTEGCHADSPSSYCPGQQAIGPACQWRTVKDGTSTWAWTVTYTANQPWSIGCSLTNFPGPH